MKQLLYTASQTAEELHLLEYDVILLRVPALQRRDFCFTRDQRDLQEILHRKKYRFFILSQNGIAASSCIIRGRHRC